MQIVAVQMDMLWQDPAENFRRIESQLEETPPPAGSLVVLPEMFATGFSMNLDVTASEESRSSEGVMQRLAARYDVAVLGGVVGPRCDGQASNQAVAFAPDGTELVRYTKQQPFTPSGEHIKYHRGSEHKLFQWQGVTIAPFVCYDLRFPELFRAAVAAGAEVLLVIACWPAARSIHWIRLLQARAIENLAAVVGVNRCGSEPNLDFDGRSTAFDHQGGQLFEAQASPVVHTADLDVAALRKWRKDFPALDDMRL